MSTQGIRDFRPAIHFSPAKGWTNDPNGLVFHDGKYHLFYQHYPDDGVWGPMHWGHASSEDLIKWEHLPIAIYPDKDGMIFSGSAVSDTQNLSGLGKDGQIPLIAMYTCHGEQEEQSIAYSLDGVNFTKYEKNPVIPNPGLKDFRDPKMFWNPVKNCWSMVLAATDRANFYASKDLISWEKTGEFGPDKNYAPGVWECPDMIPLEHNGKTLWLFIASMTGKPGEYGVGTQYFLGDFDGDAFVNPIDFGYAEQIDSGCDNYAGVTFNNADKPVFVGWALNWQYAKDAPTGIYCGQMTLPRRLSVEDTPQGPRLASCPILPEGLTAGKMPVDGSGSINSETFIVRAEGSGPCEITLSNDKNQSLTFGVDADNSLFADRTASGTKDFSKVYASPDFSARKAKRFFGSPYSLEFVFDVSIFELFIDEGTRNMTMACYPDSPYTKISVKGSAAVTLSE